MLRTTTSLVGVAAVAVALTFTLASGASNPGSAPVVRVTHMGKTAQQWHRIAVQRRLARDWYHSRLGEETRQAKRLHRELLQLQARFKAAPTRPPHYIEWMCIHGGEGAWTSNTGNGYYGGLQFAQSTWDSNGGEQYASRADLATPIEQMWVAESAWHQSGGSFAQWPNTARACGLL